MSITFKRVVNVGLLLVLTFLAVGLSSRWLARTGSIAATADGVPTDESVFGYDYKFDTSGSLRVLRPRAEKYQSVNSLSGGEQWRLIVDVATRVAKHGARVGPIVLLLEQSKIWMDPTGWSWLFEWIKNKKPPFQTVVDLCYAPSKADLAGALCYKAKGDDMEVTAFEVMT